MSRESFNTYYSAVYGSRWPKLLESLSGDAVMVSRLNRWVENRSLPRDPQSGLLASYVMDPASVIVARALEVTEGDQILDMCAAPGGKSLILIEDMGEEGGLIANEISEARRDRLTKVIQNYVPRTVRDRVRVAGKDGGLFAKSHPETFDKILVDAPCSGERHLLENEKEMAEWSESRSKKLAQRQYALLTAALLCLKPGGKIVYSTCSISPLENDEVLRKLLKKKDGFEVLAGTLPVHAERTELGMQFLPDQLGGGPLYWAILRKSE